jgi:hypothetical protein
VILTIYHITIIEGVEKVNVTIEKPERIAKLPHYKGLPITATTLVDDNGVPNFKSIDNSKVWECKRDGKCAICGEALDYWLAFMVTEEEAEKRIIFESPQHVDCLKYAFQICPWLFYSKAKYSDPKTVKMEGVTFGHSHPDREKSLERQDMLGIYVCRSYENVIIKGYRVCKVPKAKYIEWIKGN